MHSSFRVSRTAALFGEPMMPANRFTPASICFDTAPGVRSLLYWSSSIVVLDLEVAEELLLVGVLDVGLEAVLHRGECGRGNATGQRHGRTDLDGAADGLRRRRPGRRNRRVHGPASWSRPWSPVQPWCRCRRRWSRTRTCRRWCPPTSWRWCRSTWSRRCCMQRSMSLLPVQLPAGVRMNVASSASPSVCGSGLCGCSDRCVDGTRARRSRYNPHEP